jgi:hypothetical protein
VFTGYEKNPSVTVNTVKYDFLALSRHIQQIHHPIFKMAATLRAAFKQPTSV